MSKIKTGKREAFIPSQGQKRFSGGKQSLTTLKLHDLVTHCDACKAAGKIDESIAAYRIWINANSSSPLKYVAVYNLAATLSSIGANSESLALFQESVRLNPTFPEGRLNVGSLLETMGRNEEAIQEWMKLAYPEASLLPPKDNSPPHNPPSLPLRIEALNHIGRVYERCREFDLAEEHLLNSIALNPKQPDVLHHILMLRRKQCKWPIYSAIPGVTHCEMLLATSPISMLAESDDPLQQLLASVSLVGRKIKPTQASLWTGQLYKHSRLRVGYLSADFKVHAVGLLLPEIFECHDRTKVETFGFCISGDDGSENRKRIIQSLDHFEEVSQMTDSQIAQRIRDCEIDILIDLMGHSQGCRPEVLSPRPAPVQISWLGFIGTSALPQIDYVIADKVSLPPELTPFFKEKPLYLPHSFLPKDWKGAIPETDTRKNNHLPEDRFVFASFNNIYKLNAKMFTVWMNILTRVPDSVLWLLDDNKWATENLRKFAASREIDPGRFIFAGRVNHNAYRARLPLADLFLDNHPYNAGSTAVDVLAMGLPLLTLAGKTFVSRMGAGLLHQIGMNDLITDSHDAYEEKAVELATHPVILKNLRSKISEANQQRRPSSQEFTRNLEHLYFSCLKGSEYGLTRPATNPAPGAASPSAKDSLNTGVHTSSRSKTMLIRGWRGINHPYSLFSQFHLLEFLKQDHLILFHEDVPYFSSNWSPSLNPAGFEADETRKLRTIQSYDGRQVDLAVSIAYPHSLFTGAANKVITFMAPETAVEPSQFSPNSTGFATFTEGRNWVVTPSEWGKRTLVEAGLNPEKITVLSPGVDTRLFKPLPMADRSNFRSHLKIAPDEFAFLYLGSAFWAEGCDLVLKAFHRVSQQNPKVKLIVKDYRSLWGRSIDATIAELQRTDPGAISVESMARIVTLPGEVSLSQLGAIYSAADLLVHPYRASCLNLSLLESIASGTRVLATQGGPSDECHLEGSLHQIRSVLSDPKLTGAATNGPYLEPEFEDLVQKMLGASQTPTFQKPLPPLQEDPQRKAFLDARSWQASSQHILQLLAD